MRFIFLSERQSFTSKINCITNIKDNLFLNILFESIGVSVMFLPLSRKMISKFQ